MAGIQQLLSLLSPVGAVIQAIIKTYTTIQFFIQRINQILDLVESIVNSVSAIAAGSLGQAAGFIERTMARTIPVILDFLARFIGLGDVGGQVQRTIQGLQMRVDQMLDRAVDWIRERARSLMERAAGGTPQQRLDQALSAGQSAVNRFARQRVGEIILRPLLAVIRTRYQLQTLEAIPRGERWAVRGTVNPSGERPTDAQVESGSGTTPEAGVTFSAAGESHRLWSVTTGGQRRLMIASGVGQEVENLLQQMEAQMPDLSDTGRTQASAVIGRIRGGQSQITSTENLTLILNRLSTNWAELFVIFGEIAPVSAAAIRLAARGRSLAVRHQSYWRSWMAARRLHSPNYSDKIFASTADGYLCMSGSLNDAFLRQINEPEDLEILNRQPAAATLRGMIARQRAIGTDSHAEIKVSSGRPNEPLGVSDAMCRTFCPPHFTGLARSGRVIQVIDDGGGTPRIFRS
jgi:hypothetical protein